MNCRRLIAVIALTLYSVASAAWADDAAKLDLVKLAIGQRGNWDTAITELGTKAGIFKKHGIELEMTYTSGSGETLQPVISGAVDAGLAVGTIGAIAAYAKGAPVRIIGAEATGAADYWYAKDLVSDQDAQGSPTATRSPFRPTARRPTRSCAPSSTSSSSPRSRWRPAIRPRP